MSGQSRISAALLVKNNCRWKSIIWDWLFATELFCIQWPECFTQGCSVRILSIQKLTKSFDFVSQEESINISMESVMKLTLTSEFSPFGYYFVHPDWTVCTFFLGDGLCSFSSALLMGEKKARGSLMFGLTESIGCRHLSACQIREAVKSIRSLDG